MRKQLSAISYQPSVVSHQQGFGAIAAIVILVILAVLAAAITTVGSTQQMTSAQDVMSAKAWQAARAGNEWGLYQAMRGTWTTSCPAFEPFIDANGNRIRESSETYTDTNGNAAYDPPQMATLNLTADTGFYVTVFCDSWLYNEGESAPSTAQPVRMYRITAVACPASACPVSDATVAGAGYIERTRVVMAQTIVP